MRHRLIGWAPAAVFALLTASAPARAVPVLEKDVLCGDQNCGTMRINRYDTSTFEANTKKFVGVVIEGKFEPKKDATYHYIQAILEDTFPPSFIDPDHTRIVVPYIDAPPGGYFNFPGNYPLDLLPYYDQTNPELIRFPAFYDQPGVPVTEPIGVNQSVTVKFETWLVCVINETFGSDTAHALDDQFRVAPLLGWTWGFTAKRTSSEEDFAGWTTTKFDLTPLTGQPSANWQAAAEREYGKDASKDRFHVTLGDCKDCFQESPPRVSQPLSLILLGAGLVLLLRRAHTNVMTRSDPGLPTRRRRVLRSAG